MQRHKMIFPAAPNSTMQRQMHGSLGRPYRTAFAAGNALSLSHISTVLSALSHPLCTLSLSRFYCTFRSSSNKCQVLAWANAGKLTIARSHPERLFDTLDLTTETWNRSAAPAGFSEVSTRNVGSQQIVNGDKIFVGEGNFSSNYQPWEFDLKTMRSNTLELGALDNQRIRGAAIAASSTAYYLVGGADTGLFGLSAKSHEHDALTRVLCWEGQQWVNKAPMKTARVYAASAWMNGALYVCGGSKSTGDVFGFYRSVEVYNPEQNSWSAGPPMIRGLACHTAAVFNGKLYVVGSEHGGIGPSRVHVEMLDPSTGVWVSRASSSTAREGALCVCVS